MKRIISLLLVLMLIPALVLPVSADSSAFADVPATHWANGAVERAYADRILNGTGVDEKGARLFSPEKSLTTAEFIAILTRAFYADELASADAAKVKDAYGSDWFAVNLYVADLHMLRDGCNSQPTEAISRFDMAQVILNLMLDKLGYYVLPEADALNKTITEIADFHTVPYDYGYAVAYSFHEGIIKGVDAVGTFDGQSSMNRGQAATVYCRLADKLSAAAAKAEEELPSIREDVLKLVNEERAAVGLPALILDDTLCEAAQIRAAEVKVYFSHDRPDGSECFSVLADLGYYYRAAGENIASGQRDAEMVMEDWVNSPGHYANIIDVDFGRIGIGYYEGAWVQLVSD